MNRRLLLNFMLIALTTGILGISTVEAQLASNNASDPIGQLEGFWQGEGKFSGMQASAQAKWEWMLGGKFLRLNIRYEMKLPDGKKQAFEGHGYYKPKGNGKYEGRWFDSQGNSYPVQGTLENGTLTSMWGESENYNGKSVYRFSATEKTLEVTDFTKQKDGSWKEFSNFKLTPSK